MNKDQALSIVAHAAALAPLPKAQHIQIEEALKVLAEAIKNAD